MDDVPEVMEPLWDMADRPQLAEDDEGEHYRATMEDDPYFGRVMKIGAVVNVSADTLMDYGLIPDTREPVKVSRRQRLRWRWQEKRCAARMRLASWVAVFDVTERD